MTARMRSLRHAVRRLFFVIAVLAVLPASLPMLTTVQAAETASPLIIKQQRQQQKSLEEGAQGEIQQRPGKAAPRVEVEAPTLLPSGQCQTVRHVWLYGADHLPATVRQRLLAPFIEHCLDNAGVARLARALQEWYLQAGYITTRVSIKQPQNSFDKGNLELWVVEGRIGRFILGKDTAFDRDRIASAFPVKSGDVLNIHDLDQGLDQLDRLFSQKFRMQIKPGDQPGYSNILLIEYAQNDAELYPHAPSRNLGRQQLSYSYSNGGSESTGEHVNSLTFTRENLLGFNDVIAATWQRSAPYSSDRKGNETQLVDFTVPYGNWLFGLNHYRGTTVQTVNSGSVPFFSKQKIATTSFKMSRMLFRDQRNKLKGFLRVERSDRDSYINDTLIQISSRRLATLEAGLNATHYFPTATLITVPSIVHGLPWFGALSDPAGIASDQPHASYTLLRLFMLYNQRILSRSRTPFSYQLTFNGQFSPFTLYGEKQFILGGQYSVRGFKENALSSDSGWSTRNDLIFPVGTWLHLRQAYNWLSPLRARLFADYGRAYAAGGGYQGSLGGWGVGVDWRYRWFDFSYSYARPFHGENQFTRPEHQVHYFGLTVNAVF